MCLSWSAAAQESGVLLVEAPAGAQCEVARVGTGPAPLLMRMEAGTHVVRCSMLVQGVRVEQQATAQVEGGKGTRVRLLKGEP